MCMHICLRSGNCRGGEQQWGRRWLLMWYFYDGKRGVVFEKFNDLLLLSLPFIVPFELGWTPWI
jgi:hypothetical protein